MGGEGHRLAGEEIEKEERGLGRIGEGAVESGNEYKVCYDPAQSGWSPAGVAQKGASTRDLLSSVALARPTDPSRVETSGVLRVRVRAETNRCVHQPLSLLQGGTTRWTRIHLGTFILHC